ncbi:MAG: hypothetical protein LBE24_05540 [Methylobacillus sp.]|jgi:hypothetical protein|nr:hypothetical protein [Methylobacillus sp.]
MNQSNEKDNADGQPKKRKGHPISIVFTLLGSLSCSVAAIFSLQQNGVMALGFGIAAFFLILIGLIAGKILSAAAANSEKQQ